MNHRIVMLYSGQEDPLMTAARQAANTTVDFVHIDDLLPFLDREEWPAWLSANFPDEIGRRFRDAVVINRIFSTTGTRTEDTLRGWGRDERWLHIRLDDLLRKAAWRAHDVGVRGVSHCLLPLNTQWFRVAQYDPTIATPAFSYAVGYEEPDLAGLADPMQKSVWSLFDWKEEHHILPAERMRHRFFVEAPKGLPLFGHFYGESVHTTFPRDRADFSSDQVNRIAKACRIQFQSDVGEFLSYVEGDGTLRFHAFSPYMLSAATDTSFHDHVSAWLTSLATLKSLTQDATMAA
ncbi:MAG TPA: hypothetical protein VM621_14625 [Luteibacter sp.]|uniref:hypothetical protein n=1 Tax=Luteibacter sp. TaxID=1886636 RepID=UPI002C634EDB|nr:hypothetical protein [Luteibacter sp.]HVI56275.1 hypothetical protein [Luteibacter sp.]